MQFQKQPDHDLDRLSAKRLGAQGVGSRCDPAQQQRLIIAVEFFSTKNGAPPRNKAPSPQITPMQRSLAICRASDRRGKVTPTKIVLIVLLLASAISNAFP